MHEYWHDAEAGEWRGVDVRRRTVLVPSPAAGADWSVQVPGGERWSVRGLVAQLQTTAAVGNRGARLERTDGSVRVLSLQPSQIQSPSIVARWSLVVGGPMGANAQSQAGQWGGPAPFILNPGWILQTSTINIDVADQWSQIAIDILWEPCRGDAAQRRFEEWQESERQRWASLPPLSV